MGYFIKEAAKKLTVSRYTLRYYDKEGLTPFLKKDKNGVRIYTDEDLEWIKMLLNLRDIDMPIKKIKEYIDLYMKGSETINERRELMIRYKEYVKKKIEETVRSMEYATKELCKYDKDVADILDDS